MLCGFLQEWQWLTASGDKITFGTPWFLACQLGDSGFPELDLGEHLPRSWWDGVYLGRSWNSRSQLIRTGSFGVCVGGVWALESKLEGLGPGCLLTCHVLGSSNFILYSVLICKIGLMAAWIS